MADDKKTQLGTTPGRTHRPTGGQQPVVASPTAQPFGTPAPGEDLSISTTLKTSYLPDQADPLIGTTLAGRYLLHQKLGEGGMGAVYLATHTILEKQVALKVLHGEFARKPDLVDRFMQEAKAASRIRHENVIDISDFGSTPDGMVFFAMELLTGHDLHEEVARAKLTGQLLPWSRSKKIFLQICAALSAAHAKGIVHRDLKPENVYLVEFLGDPDFVKLLDFGIAKLAETEGDGGRKLTKTGMLFGTPEYMSPEQARGEKVDHRVDIYAMGCILFQLVSGRVPFEADNFMGVLSLHLTEAPPQIAPETFDMIGAPRALADVIDRALAKDRNERWQTIDDLAAAVREVSGDPAPVERSGLLRVANVQGPVSTVRARPPTAEVAPRAASDPGASRSSRETGRQKTQWTGSVRVPEVPVEQPRPAARSKLPLVIGALVVLGGGGAAAFMLTRDPGTGTSADTTGSAAAAASAPTIAPTPPQPPPQPQPAPPPAPPAPPPEPLPDMAVITLDSTPKGATVTDLTANKVLGTTPQRFKLHGSHAPRQFKFHLHGYGDTTVELVPDHPTIAYTETLQKGATVAGGSVHKVSDDPARAAAGAAAGSAAAATVTTPDTSAGSPVQHPDTATPDTTKPDTTKPDTTKPDTTKPDTAKPADKPKDDCPDDEQPCLKRNIPGLGSNGS